MIELRLKHNICIRAQHVPSMERASFIELNTTYIRYLAVALGHEVPASGSCLFVLISKVHRTPGTSGAPALG